MNWVEFWAKWHVIEKVVGVGIFALILLVVGGLWLYITISDWWYYRKKK